MRRLISSIVLVPAAFAAGLFVAPHVPRADAAPPAIAAQAVDIAALTYKTLPVPASGAMRKKLFVDVEGMTLGVYAGPTVRHYHANSNEMQYVIAGTGSEWFGKKRIALKPGMLLVIPKGMTHGGVSARLTLLEMKTPAQDPEDNHPI